MNESQKYYQYTQIKLIYQCGNWLTKPKCLLGNFIWFLRQDMGWEYLWELVLQLPPRSTLLSLWKSGVTSALPPTAVPSVLHSSRRAPFQIPFIQAICVSDLAKIWQNRYTHTQWKLLKVECQTLLYQSGSSQENRKHTRHFSRENRIQGINRNWR